MGLSFALGVGLLGGVVARVERLEVEVDEFFRHCCTDDGLPVDVVHRQGLCHRAEEDDVHALRVAQGHGDVRGIQAIGLEMLLHGFQAAFRVGKLPGCDGGGGHLVVVDDGNTVGLQKVGIADSFHHIPRQDFSSV